MPDLTSAPMLTLTDAELRALVTGETIVAFVGRGDLDEGDEVALTSAGPAAAPDLKPAYRRWAEAGPPAGQWIAVVDGIEPAAILDPVAGAARHIRVEPGDGDLVLLRVYGESGPVLSNTAYAARRRSVIGALTQ